MTEISLVSLNIERSKHLDLVIPFLKNRAPEVATIQECMERDIPALQAALGATYFFYTPLCEYKPRADESGGIFGQVIFSVYPLTNTKEVYYFGSRDQLYPFGEDKEPEILQVARALTVVEFEKEGEPFRVATTHFTWSMGGRTSERQQSDLKTVLALLKDIPDFVLTGDFNAPRSFDGKPGEIFAALASHYKDNIPPRYQTSIDISMHYAGKTHARDLRERMVDGLFTTPEYVASNVELHPGISDHFAVTGIVSKL